MKPRRLIRWAILIGVGVVLSLVVVSYYRFNEQLRSEYETVRVVQMIEDYVTTHDGNWPSSWEDLDATETAKRLTQDSTYYRQYTTVDFSLTSDNLVQHSEMIYTAVRPVTDKYTTYPHAREDLDRLMQAITRTSDRRPTLPAR